MSLDQEIRKRKNEIHTDGYSMSIGELISLYRDGEIDIHPEFQRFFRWTPLQKTKLIESILLGIPVPPIFVSQNDEGIWDVIDGMQRLSTIFEFVGELQRLNTLGTQLSDQEIRNCILVMVDREFYWWIKALAETKEFTSCMPLSSRQMEEQYDLELALRFLVLKNSDDNGLKGIQDIGEFLTARMLEFVKDKSFDRKSEQMVFQQTFSVLESSLSDDCFRRYDPTSERFLGGFLISAFEVVAIGVGSNIEGWSSTTVIERKNDLKSRIRSVWGNEQFQNYSGSGVRASSRIPVLVPLGKKLFKK
jgi:hypothetical protein